MKKIFYLKNRGGRGIAKVPFTCQNCGKVLMLIPSLARRRRFCSRECDRDRGTIEERISACSDPQANGCIHWIGQQDDGYGVISINGKRNKVHRLVWERRYGKISKGLVVRHKCDTPCCINLAHLELGTQADNARDRSIRGRNGDHRGINNGRAKVTWEQVREMRAQRPPRAGHYHPVPYRFFCEKYRLSISQVCFIINQRAWKETVDSKTARC